MKRDIFILTASFIAIFILSLFITPVSYDEGLAFMGAKSVLNGLTPYKDFWTIYAPGQYYLNAGIMSIFGDYIIALRIFTGISIFIIGYLINRILMEFTDKKVIFPGIISFVLLFSVNFFGRAIPSAILLILILILIISNYIKSKNSKMLIIAGILTTVITVFRQDFGAYSAISLFLFFIYYSLFIDKNEKYKAITKNIGIYFASYLISIAPVIFHFIYYSGLDNVYNQLFYFPFNVFPNYRKIDLGFDAIFHLKFGIIGALTFIYLIIISNIRLFYFISIFPIKLNFKFNNINYKVILLSLFMFMISFQAALRQDFEHLVPVTLFVMILIIFEYLYKPGNKTIKYFNLALILFLLSLPILNFAKNAKEIKNNTFEMNYAKSLKFTPINKVQNDDLKIISQKIDYTTLPEEKVFICNSFNDRIYINDILLYIYINKMPSSRVYELHPGFATHQAGQSEIIDDLNSAKNRIIIQEEIPIIEEGNLSSKSSGAFFLDNFIKYNYYEFYSKGKYKMSIRR